MSATAVGSHTVSMTRHAAWDANSYNPRHGAGRPTVTMRATPPSILATYPGVTVAIQG